MALAPELIDQILKREADHECGGVGDQMVCVRIVAIADLPSRFGRFQVVAFWNNRDGKDHIAILHGNPIGRENVPTRVHSECLTGDALGSLRSGPRGLGRSSSASLLFFGAPAALTLSFIPI